MSGTTSRVVAIVDDDGRVRISVADLLQSAGFAIKTFSSSEEFLNSGDQEKIGCLIVDVRMPRMNGLQLLEKVKQEQPDLPVVIVTGYRDDRVRERALRAGAAGFFYKPFSDLELLGAVNNAAKR